MAMRVYTEAPSHSQLVEQLLQPPFGLRLRFRGTLPSPRFGSSGGHAFGVAHSHAPYHSFRVHTTPEYGTLLHFLARMRLRLRQFCQ